MVAKAPRFSRRDRTPRPRVGRGGTLGSSSPRGGSLRFRGRTPSAAGGSGGVPMGASGLVRGHGGRELALRLALACLALCFVFAWARSLIGDSAPWPAARGLQIFRAPAFPTGLAAQLQPVRTGWWETFAALGTLVAETTQELDPQEIGARGAIWLLLLSWSAVIVWFALAKMGDWRRPSLPLSLLLLLQIFGAAYYLSSFRSPARRLQTGGIAFDFHTHTTRSNGLMTPQQQINWHRARGFKGLAFTDADRIMPQSTLEALRAANPDMLLLNGCEYHGRDAHLLFFGLKSALSSHDMTAPRAIAAAKKQGALIIVPHPWSPGRYSASQFRAMGVDGFEPWNGVIGDRNLAIDTRNRNLVVTGATDTLSKSGARCTVWTLLPRGLDDADDVLRALRLRKTAIAYTVSSAETPQRFKARRDAARGPGAVLAAIGAAWATLSRAQKLNALLGLIAVVAALWAWGAESARKPSLAVGPQSAGKFLRRKRFLPRAFGVLLIFAAFALSILIAVASMSGTWKNALWAQSLTPIVALIVWLLCDALYLYGRALWRRVQ